MHIVGPGIRKKKTLKNMLKCDTNTVGYIARNWPTKKMRKLPVRIWNIVSNNEQGEKWEMYTVERGIWREILKNVKN